MWISIKNPDQVIWLVGNYKWAWHLNLFSMRRAKMVQFNDFVLWQAYKLGLFGKKIIWAFHGWYSHEFWRTDLEDVPCSEEEMEQAARGAFVFGYYPKNRIIERGIAGLTGTCVCVCVCVCIYIYICVCVCVCVCVWCVCVYTIDSRYLEFQGTFWNTSRYPYLVISDLQNWGKNNSNNHI